MIYFLKQPSASNAHIEVVDIIVCNLNAECSPSRSILVNCPGRVVTTNLTVVSVLYSL